MSAHIDPVSVEKEEQTGAGPEFDEHERLRDAGVCIVEANGEGGTAPDVVGLCAAGANTTQELLLVRRVKVSECRHGIAVRHRRGDAGVVGGKRMLAVSDHQFLDRREQQRWPLLRRFC